MKKLLSLIILLLSISTYGQRYFPKLNNFFIDKSDDESIFSEDLQYFRKGLRDANNKLFYTNLQMSTGTNVGWYSLGIIPRFVTESNFMNTGILIKFYVDDKVEHSYFPVIFDEYAEISGDERTGSGKLTIGNKGMSLQFEKNQFTAIDNQKKKELKEVKVEFFIEHIFYTINDKRLEIKIIGAFNTDFKIKKQNFSKEEVTSLEINVEKESLLFKFHAYQPNREIVILNKKIMEK
jgi:hypothetical protein